MALGPKTHKFKVGQRVSFDGVGRGQMTSSRFTVTRLLPRVGATLSYRIKGDDETHERVAEEAQLDGLF